MIERNTAAMGPFHTKVPRTLDASVERVFDAWIEPASVKAWLAHDGNASVDAREGGLFYIEMPHEGRFYPHYGRYLRIERPTLLEFTWVSEGTLGKESVVTIELTPRGERTELLLRHEGLPTEEWAKSHNGGWSGFLDLLVERL
ncbi:SRPBCC domain-containing protein [Dokdonella sp.]|uniref:SRPBCC family protein n=1 Tax=Dokdonella sp. TaxID=2291710 RepID=UPI001B0D273A|nr:SRPBCC domain-containing protein [Dokdonella sp.]MBO9662712.1 SRPBCC domain-containing protein [Dokdonella sp.]